VAQSRQQSLPKLGDIIVDGIWVYSGVSYCLGKISAKRDLRAGRLCLQTFGTPAQWRDAYSAILERHGVKLTPVCDGPVSGKVREKIRGYNSVMKLLIKKRLGRDFLQMVVEQARDQAAKPNIST